MFRAGVARQIPVAGIAHHDALAGGVLDRHFVAGTRHGEAENVETRAHVPDRSGRERRDAEQRRAHDTPSCRMSLSTPAAVTAGPAPGPVITSGFVL